MNRNTITGLALALSMACAAMAQEKKDADLKALQSALDASDSAAPKKAAEAAPAEAPQPKRIAPPAEPPAPKAKPVQPQPAMKPMELKPLPAPQAKQVDPQQPIQSAPGSAPGSAATSSSAQPAGRAPSGGPAVNTGPDGKPLVNMPAPLPSSALSTVKEKAIAVLTAAGVGNDPALRSNAIEAMQPLPERARPLVARGLGDQNPGVRFAAVVTAGMLKFRDLNPAIRPLLSDTNTSVQAAALYALYVLGEKVDITPLADMLRGRDPRLRGNVALLLGLLGDKSAISLLRSTASVPMPRASASDNAVVRIQVAEAVAKLGDDSALDALRAGAFSQFDEVRVLSVTAMGEVGDRRMELALDKMLTNQPIEIQLAAAAALARLGNFKGVEAVKVAALSHQSPVARAQAAWSLGWFQDDGSLAVLDKLLDDPAKQVQVSAAASLVRRLAAVGAATANR
jgi:HEAT repeat protein